MNYNMVVIKLKYEALLIEADCNNIITKEKPLRIYDGRIKGDKILIRSGMTENKRSCVLAEELGHYYTTVGNILDQTNTDNRKQELHARLWAYNKLIGLSGIVRAYEHGCTSLSEMANYLEVTEEFLLEALQTYKRKYGTSVEYENYKISFVPNLKVCQK